MQYSCTTGRQPAHPNLWTAPRTGWRPRRHPAVDACSSTSNVLGVSAGVGSGDITTSAPPGHHASSFTVRSRPCRTELGQSLRAYGGCRRQLTAITQMFKAHPTRVAPRLTSGRVTW
jgi:hypothetical protein